MNRLTDRQRQAWDFIRHFIAEEGYAPKLSEIARGLNIRSRGTVHRYVQALVDAGLIRVKPLMQRGIELVEDAINSPRETDIPLLGTIAAGHPIEAIANPEPVDPSAWFGPDSYALAVKGDSMIEAGILEGDIVVCRPAEQVDAHQIAVVLVNQQEATLKYCREHQDGTITLIPANQTLKPQTYPADAIQIQGVVIGQLRRY